MTAATVHLSDPGSRQLQPLCRAEGQGQVVWGLARSRPARAYVGNTRFTVPVPVIHSLQEGGQNLEPCEACVREVHAISERLIAGGG